jgi:sterol desaturase/sphingolipid hydroxylase (fatty acid hydroxylase superfamily)
VTFVPGWSTLAVASAVMVLLFLERLFPLRPRTEPQAARLARNLALAGLSATVVTLLQPLALGPVARLVDARELGLLALLPLPPWASLAAAVLLLDYTLWHWHRWTHRVGWLWRFHLVHHVDRDLDVSTALRFHLGEMALSIPYRGAQMALIGAGSQALGLWTGVLLVSIAFHHSNLRLPDGLERWLVRLVVTPRMHGIHHSERREETDSNFASLFSVWDALHRTLRLDAPGGPEAADRPGPVIGVPGYRDRKDLGFGALLALPFRRHHPYWPEKA